MKIGVLSDTHIPRKASKLPETVLRALEGVDHIIHAGDIADLSVIRALENIAPVTAVAGNVDPPELHELYGQKKLITLGGFNIGVVHGDGYRGRTIDRAAASFTEHTDCIVFGHSHIPFCGMYGGVLMFNPGSPTDKRRTTYYSFGVIDVGTSLVPRIVLFDANGVIQSEQ
jgi:putative phosphoesterase